jgi:hypothetical protein
VSDDVSPLDPELTHEEQAMPGMVGHRHRHFDKAAASEPGAVVAEQAVAVDEDSLLQKWLRPRGAHTPVDQHDGLSRAS